MPYLSIQMACRRLPYYHRFLHRENFSSPLKVVYRKPLKEEKGYTGKYQWDLIHNPESVLFSWLEEEEEGEIVDDNCFEKEENYKAYISIRDELLNDIIFKQVYEYIDGIEYITYCVSEFSKEEEEDYTEQYKPIPYGNATEIKAVPSLLITTKTVDRNNIPNTFLIKDLVGDINLNDDITSSGFNKFCIFHEFIHASQYLYYSSVTNSPLFEIEDRIVALYSLYLRADQTIRHNSYEFSEFVKSNFGEWTYQFPFLSSYVIGVNNFYPGAGKSGFDLITSYFDLKIENRLNEQSDEVMTIKNQLKEFLDSYANYLRNSSTYDYKQSDIDLWDKQLYYFENFID